VNAIKLDAKDRVIGFVLTHKKREGLTVRTNRGATQIVRATKFPVASRGGKGYAILQRGSLEALLPDEAEPVPPLEEFNEGAARANGGAGSDQLTPNDDGDKDR
jgi:DNA gyrase subunit A